MASNVTTIALFAPAMKFIATDNVALADKVVVTLIVVLIVLAAVVLPMALTLLAPGRPAVASRP
jgi:hypothetical protein